MNEFHEKFDELSRNMLEKVRDDLLELVGTCTRESILAQLIMNEMFAHPCDPENDGRDVGMLTTEAKASLVRMADHMGPDWAQALYRSAVFITKVA